MIRLNQTLKAKKDGPVKELEINCRSNLALCKLNTKEYEAVIEQCEKILEHDDSHTKAAFRMAQALWGQVSDEASDNSESTETQLRAAKKWIGRAH